MEKSEYRKNAYAMIYLSACAVNGKVPKAERLQKYDLDTVFEVCQDHIMTACACYALETAGVQHHEFSQEKEKAIRKNILLDAERRNILSRMEQEGIWYMPLKGAILKDWYPRLGMRQMSDNDILCDPDRRESIRDIMLDNGFTCKLFGKKHSDEYIKPPVFNFEMHNSLFTEISTGGMYKYYENIKEKLIKDEGNSFGYHFSDEDFYIYLIAHEYKHYADGGVGVRSLLDIYVIMRKYGNSFNWSYIKTELGKLGIAEFEKMSRELALKLFCLKKLEKEELKQLDYFIFSGTYGNIENKVENNIRMSEGGSKASYVFHRFFPSMDFIRICYPFFYRHKCLLPLLIIYRPVYGVLKRRKKITSEIRTLMK